MNLCTFETQSRLTEYASEMSGRKQWKRKSSFKRYGLWYSLTSGLTLLPYVIPGRQLCWRLTCGTEHKSFKLLNREHGRRENVCGSWYGMLSTLTFISNVLLKHYFVRNLRLCNLFCRLLSYLYCQFQLFLNLHLTVMQIVVINTVYMLLPL